MMPDGYEDASFGKLDAFASYMYVHMARTKSWRVKGKHGQKEWKGGQEKKAVKWLIGRWLASWP